MTDKQPVEAEKKERKPLVINDETLKSLRATHSFRSAAPGKFHDSPITGATARWQKEGGDKIIYDQVFRTVGSEEQVREELGRAGAKKAEIDDAVAQAFTSESVTKAGPIRDQFLAELEDVKMKLYAARDYGLEWTDVAPFFQAKKTDIDRKNKARAAKGKSTKGKAKKPAEPKERKKKTPAEVRKDLIERNSDFLITFFPNGWSRMKKTSVGRLYYYNEAQHIALQTPEDLKDAKAAIDFGDFDITKEFNEWYQKQEKKPVAPAPALAPAPAPAVEAPAARKQSPVKAAKAAPAAKVETAAPAKVEPVAKVEAAKSSTADTKPAAPRRGRGKP